jgi:hypothetical protein
VIDFANLIPARVPRKAVFQQEGWCLWDPCVIRSSDGHYHLFYSRWKRSLGFDAWATHAEIAWATATEAAGPYEFRSVVLSGQTSMSWDAHSVYNVCVVPYGDKFYLYYTGNCGSDAWRPDRKIDISSEEWWVQRNNQRIGVAVADAPQGPWKRFESPLLDVGPDLGYGITAVPNALVLPDGRMRLYYKTRAPGPGKFGGGVFHYSATAPGPLGPFQRDPTPMVDKGEWLEGENQFHFHIDDHFEWFQNDRYYAIVKDHDEPFLTPHGRSLILLESPDGLDWHPSPHLLVKDFSIAWEDGAQQNFQRLEMPKLLLENGCPQLLSLAAQPVNSQDSFLVILELNRPAEVCGVGAGG